MVRCSQPTAWICLYYQCTYQVRRKPCRAIRSLHADGTYRPARRVGGFFRMSFDFEAGVLHLSSETKLTESHSMPRAIQGSCLTISLSNPSLSRKRIRLVLSDHIESGCVERQQPLEVPEQGYPWFILILNFSQFLPRFSETSFV